MRGRRGGAFSTFASNPTLVGAITTLIMVVAVFLAYNANHGLPFVSSYRVSVLLPNAGSLVPGNDVRIGGVQVGTIESVEPQQRDNGAVLARADLRLEGSVNPLPVDSSVVVRAKSALGLKYLEIDQGTSHKGYPPGSTIPLSAAHPEPVDIDQLLNTFDKPTRRAIQENLTAFGTGLGGRGPALNQAIRDLRPRPPSKSGDRRPAPAARPPRAGGAEPELPEDRTGQVRDRAGEHGGRGGPGGRDAGPHVRRAGLDLRRPRQRGPPIHPGDHLEDAAHLRRGPGGAAADSALPDPLGGSLPRPPAGNPGARDRRAHSRGGIQDRHPRPAAVPPAQRAIATHGGGPAPAQQRLGCTIGHQQAHQDQRHPEALAGLRYSRAIGLQLRDASLLERRQHVGFRQRKRKLPALQPPAGTLRPQQRGKPLDACGERRRAQSDRQFPACESLPEHCFAGPAA